RITGFSSPPFPPPSSFLRRRCHLSKVHTATSRFNLHPRSFGPTTSLNSS
ncbi:Zinc finger-containing ubiquitin peptidase 1, partial [Clarias magur]